MPETLIKIIALFACAFAAVTASWAAETPSPAPVGVRLSLDEAIRAALEHNPELVAAAKRVEAATGRAAQTRVWRNPDLEFSAEGVPIHAGGLSRSQQFVGAAQTIPFPGKRILAIESSRKEIEIGIWEYHAARIAVALEVKSAFYRALAAHRRVEISSQLVQLAESLAEAARKRAAAGATSAQEQLRVEIEAQRIISELAARRSELAAARQSLAALLDKTELADATPVGALAESADAGDLKQLREQMLDNNPRLAAAIAERERAEIELRRAQRDALPDPTFSVAVGRDRAARETLMEFRVSLPLPLFDRSQGKIREARANADIARAELTATEQRLLRDLSAAEAKLRAAVEQVTIYRERILPKSAEALRLAQTGFEQGKLTFLDLLDTQRTVTEATLAYQEKLLELNITRAELESLLQRDAQSPPFNQPPPPK